ncbi:MAG: phenylalanine--tRNA ligase beta subunit-related protein [Candidatus Shikimatogenerans bostrichidophilus]|nr:MAG: phenylalanine--tRNA ligase beta subunit-related protein [Candidatus Shikimatogenerans bostrichidophilus]
MKILFSWLKEFIKFNYKIKDICKILNSIGIEILYVKKIYLINLLFKKNIIKSKILFIKKKKKFFLFKIKINNIKYLFIKSKKYIKKNSYILIENINNKYYIVCDDSNYDYIIKTFITYNISYLSNYYNLAKEIHYYLKYKNKKSFLIKFNKIKKSNIYKKFISIKNKNPNILYYNSYLLKNVNIKNSNFLIQKKLILSSIKLNNNIIDIINIIILEFSITIELINYNKIKNKLIIKENNKNFIFKTKKKKINIINSNKDIFLYDNKIPIYLSGIINNNNIKVNKYSKNILLSFTLYNNKKIRKTINKYNINNNMSIIYNRKNILLKKNIYINRLLFLIKKNYLNFKKIKEIFYYKKKIKIKNIKINYKYINNIIGIKIKKSKILKILLNLKYKIINNNNKYLILKKNYNNNSKLNIINDIIRFYNINNINDNLKLNNFKLLILNIKNINSKIEIINNIISNLLINYGFNEVINTPFLNKKYILNNKKYIYIKKKKEFIYLKNHLYIKMIENIIYNFNRKKKNIKIYEIGNIYYIKNKKIIEKKYIEFLILNKKKKEENILYIYNILYIIIDKLGINNYKKKIIYNKKNNNIYDIKIYLKYKNFKIATFGNFKKKFLNYYYNFNKNIIFAILNIKNILNIIKKKKIKYKEYNNYKIIKRDLSFIIEKNLFFDNFYNLSKKILKKKLINLNLLDIYNKNLPKNKKSYTLHFVLKIKKKKNNLYIKKIFNKIKKIFNKKFNTKFKKK